jgi:hypothetical protein
MGALYHGACQYNGGAREVIAPIKLATICILRNESSFVWVSIPSFTTGGQGDRNAMSHNLFHSNWGCCD